MQGNELIWPSPFLKERLFGLSNPQGNHGESIKEAHFHVDNTPVSSQVTPFVLTGRATLTRCSTDGKKQHRVGLSWASQD